MAKIKYAVLGLAAALLAGCIGNSSEYVTYYLDKGFVGHPANEFFYVYGFPAGSYKRDNGTTVYRWASSTSQSRNRNYPQTSGGTNIYTSSNGDHQVVDNYRGSVQRQYCELRLNTDKDDIVTGINIAVDSVGKWSSSRCSEIFDKVYP